jgi:hypothetical protein
VRDAQTTLLFFIATERYDTAQTYILQTSSDRHSTYRPFVVY